MSGLNESLSTRQCPPIFLENHCFLTYSLRNWSRPRCHRNLPCTSNLKAARPRKPASFVTCRQLTTKLQLSNETSRRNIVPSSRMSCPGSHHTIPETLIRWAWFLRSAVPLEASALETAYANAGWAGKTQITRDGLDAELTRYDARLVYIANQMERIEQVREDSPRILYDFLVFPWKSGYTMPNPSLSAKQEEFEKKHSDSHQIWNRWMANTPPLATGIKGCN